MTQYEYAILCKLIELHTEEEDDINGNVHRKMYESDIEKLKKDIYEVLVINMAEAVSLNEELNKALFLDDIPNRFITKTKINDVLNPSITKAEIGELKK